jgi:hypothetical protein
MTRVERFVQVVRFAALGVVVVTSLATVWGSYRHADVGDLQRDLAAGQVESFDVGPADLFEPGWRFSCTVGAVQDVGPVTVWTTGPWPWQRFSTSDLSERQAIRLGRAAGFELRTPGPNWVAIGSLIAFLSVVGAIVFGPQPRRFTKWGAFWIAMLPLGVGQVWLLVTEAPWSRAASARPEPLPHRTQAQAPEGDPRRTWFVPFLAAVLTGSVVTSLLHQLP